MASQQPQRCENSPNVIMAGLVVLFNGFLWKKSKHISVIELHECFCFSVIISLGKIFPMKNVNDKIVVILSVTTGYVEKCLQQGKKEEPRH